MEEGRHRYSALDNSSNSHNNKPGEEEVVVVDSSVERVQLVGVYLVEDNNNSNSLSNNPSKHPAQDYSQGRAPQEDRGYLGKHNLNSSKQ